MNLRSYLKRQTLTKTRKEKEESTLLIEALKTKTPQLNEVFKNTKKHQIFCGNASKNIGKTSTE